MLKSRERSPILLQSPNERPFLVVLVVLLLLSVMYRSTHVIWTPAHDMQTSSESHALCDPLLHPRRHYNRQHCILPLPNDFYLHANNQTPTGYQIQIPRAAMAPTRFGPRFDLSEWNTRDGWSPSSFIVVAGLTGNKLVATYSHTNATDDDGLHSDAEKAQAGARGGDQRDLYSFASHMYLGRSLEKESPVVLIDAETGERVEHWVTIDHSWSAKYLRPNGPLSGSGEAGEAEGHEREAGEGKVGEETSGMASFWKMAANVERLLKERHPLDGRVDGDDDGEGDDDPGAPPMQTAWLTETLLINPSKRLKSGHRYIVGLRNLRDKTVKRQDGSYGLIEAPEGFKIVRDGIETNDKALLARKQHFQDRRIFELLEPHQLESRSEWILAWDFSTASLISSTEHLRFMRDDAFERLEEAQYPYRITRVTDNYNANIYRKVEGIIRAPNYLRVTYPSVKSRLVRNPKASTYIERLRPVFQNWIDVPFILWIPHSAVRHGKASLLHYGHGLFQSREEGHVRFIQKLANEQNFAYFAGDWWGLQSADLNTIAIALLTRITSLISIPERSAQGILNQLMIMRVMRKSLMFQDPNVFAVRNRTVVTVGEDDHGRMEIKNRLYYGLSLGGILGTVYMALSPDVKVATLSVPAGPFALVFPRNDAGSLIITKLIAFHYPNSSARMILLFFMNHLWELNDPTGYTSVLSAGGILGSTPGSIDTQINGLGPKRLLIQLGITDTTVNGVASGYLVRSLGACMYPGNAYEPAFALRHTIATRIDVQRQRNDVRDPVTGFQILHKTATALHVVASFHFAGTPVLIPFFNFPPTILRAREWDTHELVRLDPKAQRQVELFFKRFENWNAKGRVDHGDVWIRDVCGGRGCWNLKRPSKEWNRWDRERISS